MDEIMEQIYASLHNDNDGIDGLIDKLKASLKETGIKSAVADARRIPVQNRQGRKVMQSYFKKRGVELEFSNITAG